MVGALIWSGERGWLPRVAVSRPAGLPVTVAALPDGDRARRLRQGCRRLRRRGIRRVILAWEPGDLPVLEGYGLRPVDPLPLCRAAGAKLALTLVERVPPRCRRVALRGEQADAGAWAVAEALCPQVGALVLDFDRGEETLARHLRARYGAAPLHLGQSPPPQASVELAPRGRPVGEALRLWGTPDLLDLELTAPGLELPPELERLPFLELLWETGRVTAEDLAACRRGNGLDRTGENTL